MKDTVRNFAIEWQDWASERSMDWGTISEWQRILYELASIADTSGELIEELKENGVI